MTHRPVTLDSLITALRAIIFHIAPRSTPSEAAFLWYVSNRISHANTRFTTLLNRWRSNTLPPIRIRVAKPRASRPAPEFRFPSARTWLLARLKSHHANIAAPRLEFVLSQEEIIRFRAEVPRADRILRPLCHMLGVTLPPPAVVKPASKSEQTPVPEAVHAEGGPGFTQPPQPPQLE